MISTRTLWGQAPNCKKIEAHPIRMPLYFLPFYLFTFPYIPMQDVAPSAVRMADATDAMICTTHLIVSFFVIRVSFFLFWHGLHGFSLLFIQPCLSKRAV